MTLLFVFLTLSYSGRIFTPSFAVFFFEYGYFFAIGVMIYLFLKRRRERISVEMSQPVFRALTVMFVFLMTAALVSVIHSLYERPLWYYASSSAAIAVVFAQVLGFNPSHGRRRFVVLAEALTVPLVNNLSLNRVQPYLFGADSTFHMTAAAQIVTSGQLPPWMGAYIFYPWFQLWGAGSMLATGTVTQGFIGGTLVHSVLIVIVSYLFLRRMTSERAALLGVLFVLASPTFMAGSIEYVPTRSGLAILLLTQWVAIRSAGQRRFLTVFFLLFVAAFLYHPVFGFLLMMVSLSGMLVSRTDVLARLFHDGRVRMWPHPSPRPPGQASRSTPVTMIAPFLFSAVTYVAYLLYVDVQVFDAIIGVFTFGESQLPALGTITGVAATPLFVLESAISSLGMTAPLVLAVPALLSWIRDDHDPAKRYFVLTYFAMLVAIGLIIIGDLFLLGPSRFLGTLDIFVALAAGPGLLFILSRIGISRRHLVLVTTVLMGLVLLSSLSYRVDANSHMSKEIPTGLGYLQEDAVASASFLVSHSTPETQVFMDRYMRYWTAGFPERTPLSVYNNPIPPTHIHDINVPSGPAPGLLVINLLSAQRDGWDPSGVEAGLPWAAQIYDNGNIRILSSP